MCHVVSAAGARYEEGEHYQEWHLDGKPPGLQDGDSEDNRALSVVVALRAAEKGGEFETYRGRGLEALKKKEVTSLVLRPGDAVVFPAQHLWHRVKAVDRGNRSSLVMWAQRPPEQNRSAKKARVDSVTRSADRNCSDSDEEWKRIEALFESGDVDEIQDDFDELSD